MLRWLVSLSFCLLLSGCLEQGIVLNKPPGGTASLVAGDPALEGAGRQPGSVSGEAETEGSQLRGSPSPSVTVVQGAAGVSAGKGSSGTGSATSAPAPSPAAEPSSSPAVACASQTSQSLGLSVSDVKSRSLTLSWIPPTGLSGHSYTLYLDDRPVADGLQTTTYTYSGLSPDTQYRLAVGVVKDGCQLSQTPGLAVRTPVQRPPSGGGGFIDPPPVIVSYTVNPDPVIGSNNVALLSCTATDNLPVTDASYSWSCSGDCGSFSSTSGRQVFWRAPATGSGPFALKVSVTDGINPPVSQTLNIPVVTGLALTSVAVPGALKWSFTTGGSMAGNGPTIDTDGTIYIVSGDGLIYALNPDGSEKWRFNSGSSGGSVSIGSDGTLYQTSSDGKIYALTPAGSLIWTFDITNPAQTSVVSPGKFGTAGAPAIGADGTLYAASLNAKLYAVNPNGTEKWVYDMGTDRTYAAPAVGPDGTIYIPNRANQRLHAVNPDGSEKWIFATSGWLYANVAIGADGTLFVGATSSPGNNRMYGINPDGSQKWVKQIGYQNYMPAAIGPDGTVYMGNEDGKLYAFDPETGDVLLSPQIASNWIETGHAVGSDGTIYFGSEDRRIYAVNPDGSEQWHFITDGSLGVSTPAIAPDGTIYIGSADHKLYALYSSSRGLASTSSWPRSYQNDQNTNRRLP
ncbi:MAG: PQQ-binding-like beta-propeller repeat protein [Candidatus Sericytochromatia bacterium]